MSDKGEPPQSAGISLLDLKREIQELKDISLAREAFFEKRLHEMQAASTSTLDILARALSSAPRVATEPAAPSSTTREDRAVGLAGVTALAQVGSLASIVTDGPISPLWSQQGFDDLAVLSRAENDFTALLEFAEMQAEAKGSGDQGHNGPPSLIDAPELDVHAVRAALAATRMLRKVVVQNEPDRELLDLLLNALRGGLDAIKKLARWGAELGKPYVHNVLESASKSPAKAAGWYALIHAIIYGPNSDINSLVNAVGRVAALFGIQ